MPSPFYFPEVDSPFLNLYNRFSQDPGSQFGPTDYLDPSDPDFQKYTQLASSPTGSEDLIRDYVSRRPSYEEYDPSFGRKMAAFLLGTLSGGGYGAAQKHLYAPLEQDIEDWQREGTGISSRARLLDAERQRELTAMKYGLQQKASSARAEAMDRYRQAGESRRMAEEVSSEEERANLLEERKSSRAFREGMSTELMDLRKDIHADRQEEIVRRRTEREEAQKKEEELAAAKEQSMDAINKKLSDFASQRGIQTKIGPGMEMTAYDIATEAATEDAMNHPAFKDLIVKTKDGHTINPKADPRRVQALKVYVENLRQKYLRGELE